MSNEKKKDLAIQICYNILHKNMEKLTEIIIRHLKYIQMEYIQMGNKNKKEYKCNKNNILNIFNITTLFNDILNIKKNKQINKQININTNKLTKLQKLQVINKNKNIYCIDIDTVFGKNMSTNKNKEINDNFQHLLNNLLRNIEQNITLNNDCKQYLLYDITKFFEHTASYKGTGDMIEQQAIYEEQKLAKYLLYSIYVFKQLLLQLNPTLTILNKSKNNTNQKNQITQSPSSSTQKTNLQKKLFKTPKKVNYNYNPQNEQVV